MNKSTLYSKWVTIHGHAISHLDLETFPQTTWYPSILDLEYIVDEMDIVKNDQSPFFGHFDVNDCAEFQTSPESELKPDLMIILSTPWIKRFGKYNYIKSILFKMILTDLLKTVSKRRLIRSRNSVDWMLASPFVSISNPVLLLLLWNKPVATDMLSFQTF
jgi:hypothetical protein